MGSDNDFRVKGKLRIGGAFLVGVLLVLGAFTMGQSEELTQQGAIVATENTKKVSLTSGEVDANGNGIADWEESLDDLGFETIETPSPKKETVSEEYVPPKTLTGKFSIAFMKDYLSGKMRGESFEDPEEFVENATESLDRSTQSKKYSRTDFVVVETTEDSLREYGNTLAAIVLSHPTNENVNGEQDVDILKRALTENDASILDELIPIQNAYAETRDDMLEMLVPTAVSKGHTNLLNGYASIHANIGAMRLALDDPLYTLVRIRNYATDARELVDAVRSISSTLEKNNIVFTSDEPGSYLYIFDI